MANLVGNSTLSGIGGPELRVELETGLGLTPSGLVEHPQFFSGIVARPEVVAWRRRLVGRRARRLGLWVCRVPRGRARPVVSWRPG